MVELSLCFLLVFSLIYALMEFSRVVYCYNILAGATREASRYAIVHGSKSGSVATASDIQAQVARWAIGLDTSALTVNTTWTPGTRRLQCACRKLVHSHSFHKSYYSGLINDRQPFRNGDFTMITRTHSQEKGTILPLAAVVVLTLVAFMGLAFDASYLYFEKRRAQTAADAGAIGGAQELLRGTPANVTTAARKDTALNRFTHGSDGVDVTVNNPPSSGPRVGNAGFVEVIVTRPRPTWFMQVLGVQSSTVKARAVAGLSDSSGCVYALNRDTSNSNNGIFVNGTTNSVFDCGVYSNANFRTVGGACVVTPLSELLRNLHQYQRLRSELRARSSRPWDPCGRSDGRAVHDAFYVALHI